MTENRFTVIKGGLDLPPEIDSRRFVSAYATDTRLMGVVAVCIHWEVEKYGVSDDIYQFFYLDAEEYALENYICIDSSSIHELANTERTLMGGLGGEHVDLTERECMCLLSYFADMSKRLGFELPGNVIEYAFLLRDYEEFTKKEKRSVMEKICTPILNYFQLVHYFVMRVFGKDFPAAEFLLSDEAKLRGDVNVDLFPDAEAATLCKNTIDIDFTSEQNTLICESLIETGDSYMMAISKVTCDDDKHVIGFERINLFRISAAEAAMQLSKGEFMTIYELTIDPVHFESIAGSLLDSSMVSTHEHGTLYMMFHKNNNHVKRRVFMLNEDVEGLIYVGETGQMLVVAYDLATISKLEMKILQSGLRSYAIPDAKYEFKESVVYDFIHSGVLDFEEFLDYIRGDDGE